MRQAVIAAPRFASGDGEALRALRERHDPQAALVPPHLTLVFPVGGAPDLRAHAAACVAGTAPFEVVLRTAVAVADPVAGGWDVQLLPDEGRDQIQRLHDRLYSGPLAAHLRADLPYVPHLTVGKLPDAERAARLAARLESARPAMRGRVEAVLLLGLGSGGATTLAVIALGQT